MEEPLQPLPIEKWADLQRAFKTEWPYGISGYKALETQREWLEKRYQYAWKVYSPYGDIWNGFVAVNVKKEAYEVIIQCPKEDTSKLEEALRFTKLVDWTKKVLVPFAPQKIIKCIRSLILHLNMEIVLDIPCFRFVLDKRSALYDVSVPSEVTFDLAKEELIDLYDSTWPHRYSTSPWYFEQLIKMKSGYTLYKDNEPIAWLFIGDTGMFTHLYVTEKERGKGYAQIIMKLVSNILLKDDKDVVVFCLKNNVSSYNLLTKIGMKKIDDVSWLHLLKIDT